MVRVAMQPISKLLKSPRLLELSDVPQIRGVFCYIIRHYGGGGLSVLYERDKVNDTVSMQFGDWDGNILDLQRDIPGGVNRHTDGPAPEQPQFEWALDQALKVLAHDYYNQYALSVLTLLSTLGIWQAQLYLTSKLVLADVRISINKLAGPGMLRELFSKIISTPEVLKIEVVDDRVLDAIRRGTGTYGGDLIIKPSAFKHLDIIDTSGKSVLTPMYIQICR